MFVSAASVWEIAIKHGKLEAHDDLEVRLEHHHFDALPISEKHAHVRPADSRITMKIRSPGCSSSNRRSEA